VSAERIRQIEVAAMKKMKAALAEYARLEQDSNVLRKRLRAAAIAAK
jgi:DNA-directed RNA polymerase sigma subunit (sigma70/sigma32)